jgi:hypothetical protein
MAKKRKKKLQREVSVENFVVEDLSPDMPCCEASRIISPGDCYEDAEYVLRTPTDEYKLCATCKDDVLAFLSEFGLKPKET